MTTLWNDIRYGSRQLIKHPGFTVAVALTLSIGIGANTAIFSFIDRLLLRPLPVERPHELVTIVEQMEEGGVSTVFNYPLYLDYRDGNQVFDGLVAYSEVTASLRTADSSEFITCMIVPGNYFSVLGVNAALGRTFLPEEDQTPASHPVAVLSHDFWCRRFGADPAIVGKTVTLNGHPFTVVGVTPLGFQGTIAGVIPAAYMPMMTQPWIMPVSDPAHNPLQARTFTWLKLLGRLKPGVAREQAQAAMRVLAEQIAKVEPMNTGTAVLVQDGCRGHGYCVQNLRLPLYLLMVIVGLVLLIACANIANLLLARAESRQKEIAIRLAVGANRGRIVRQLVSESLLLAGLGGGCGVLVAFWLSRISDVILPTDPPVHLGGATDKRIFLFAVAMTAVTGVVFGLAPALRSSRPDLVPTLKEGSAIKEVFHRRWNLRNLLAVGQVALSIMVLVCAGLCLRSLGRLQAIDLGFEPTRVLAVWVDTGFAGYTEPQGRYFFNDLKERMSALPGVQAASVTPFMPLGGRGGKRDVARIDNYEIAPGERINLDYSLVSPDYFRTLGVPMLRGRDFSTGDRAETSKVVIVNESLAQRFWPNQNPIGKRIHFDEEGRNVPEVVAVVRDGKFRDLTEAPKLMMYLPLSQSDYFVSDACLLIRSVKDPTSLIASVRGVVRSLDPDLPVVDIRTTAEHKSRLLHPQRMVATGLAALAFVGLLLMATGIYGVLAYVAARQTREIGIRMALGARSSDILRTTLAQGLKLTLIGLAVGLVASFAVTRVIRSLLYDVSPTDPFTFVCVSLLLAGVALLASYVPARRAAKIDPMEALRYE